MSEKRIFKRRQTAFRLYFRVKLNFSRLLIIERRDFFKVEIILKFAYYVREF